MKKLAVVSAILLIIITLLLGTLFSACALAEYKAVTSINLSDAQDVTGEIYFIGLPDGTPFVSFYDNDNIYHSDIPIYNFTIQGKLEDVEKHYGEKYQLKFDAEAERAVYIPHFVKMFSIYLGLLLVDIICFIGCIFALRHILKHRKN